MEFGKLPSVDGLTLTLPEDDSIERLRSRGTPDAVHLRVGTAGWSDKRFEGLIYPPRTPSGDYLTYYAKVFGTNELNSTYYGVDAARIARWASVVPRTFRFCPKVPGSISHELEFVNCERLMQEFVCAVKNFGPTLGTVWSILPPAFGPSRLRVLRRFLAQFANEVPLAIEFRHPDWFRGAGVEDGFGLLEELGVTAVITDVAGRRDVLHQRLTTGHAFIRFVGNGGHISDASRLDEWAVRLGEWVTAGLEVLDFFLHQPDDYKTVATAEHFIPTLNRHLPAGSAIPPVERVVVPRQGTLF